MRSSSHRHGPVSLLLPALLLAQLLPGVVQAQGRFPPDSFTNLKVLPKDITPRELLGTMRGFALGLGVRCTFCHVGEEGKPLGTYDFASDKKPTKRKARVMLRMVEAINHEYLPKVHEIGGADHDHAGNHEAGHEPAETDPLHSPYVTMEGGAHQHGQVICATCHRGLHRPRLLQDVLLAADQAGGLDSAIGAYRALRQQYYGSYSYDFTHRPLLETAEALQEQGKPDDALGILRLNIENSPDSRLAKQAYIAALIDQAAAAGADSVLAQVKEAEQQFGSELLDEGTLNRAGYRALGRKQTAAAVALFRLNATRHPESWNVYDSLGEGLLAAGDTTAAVTAYRKSLQLNPQNSGAADVLKRLEKQ